VNHYLDSRAALLTALKAATGSEKVIIDGSFDDKSPKFYTFSYLPAGDAVATLGDHGLDEYAGLAQIDCYSMISLGFKAHLDMQMLARSAYRHGEVLSYGGVDVRVSGASLSAVPADNKLYSRTSISVYFRYRIER
jgi:hypothetical protein